MIMASKKKQNKQTKNIPSGFSIINNIIFLSGSFALISLSLSNPRNAGRNIAYQIKMNKKNQCIKANNICTILKKTTRTEPFGPPSI